MSLDTPEPTGLSNDFATIPDVSVESIADRVAPRQVSTGSTRGAQVTAGGDGFPQVLMGSQQTFGNGFYVAKPGVDVITNTDENNLIFNSNQNVFKIVQSGIIDLPACTLSTAAASFGFSPGVTTVVPHGLGYIPALLAYANAGGEYVPLPWESMESNTATSFSRINYRVTVDATNIYGVTDMWGYDVTKTESATTAKYFLLQETANTVS